MEEYTKALLELKAAVLELKKEMIDVNHKMSEAMEHSHLKSTMSMLSNDIVLRRSLEQVIY